MNNSVEVIKALLYKLCMLGFPIDGPKNILCDNRAVCANMMCLESTLTKKHHTVDYHLSQESVAAGTSRVSKEHISTNLGDFLTKNMASPRREYLFDRFAY